MAKDQKAKEPIEEETLIESAKDDSHLRPISNFHSLIPNKTRVLLGMSGGPDSTVAAFLLKKQNIKVEGVSFVFYNYEKICQQIDRRIKKIMDDSGGVLRPDIKGLSDADKTKFLQTGCSVNNLDEVKKICDHLKIPFYAVKAEDEFEGQIFDFIISERLQGRNISPCVACNKLKLKLLYEKAALLKCDFVATGHYAKVYYSKEASSYILNASNDLGSDQSYFLGLLEQKQLERLILPLSDLQKKDVLKLVDRYKLPVKKQHIRTGREMCFNGEHSFSLFVESMIPVKYIHPGSIYHAKNNLQIGEHQGSHQFAYGMPLPELLYKKLGSYELEENLRVREVMFSNGALMIDFEENLLKDQALVSAIKMVESMDTTRPGSFYVKTSIASETYQAVLFYKNNEHGRLVFQQKVPDIYYGQVLCFYSSKQNGRILGSGVVSYCGSFEDLDRLEEYRAERRRDSESEDEEVAKKSVVFQNSF